MRELRITGHQRTGTHYITSVLCINFLNTKDYIKYYLNHKQPSIVKNDYTYIYTYRNFEDTTKSIFVMRQRFGLNVDDYETFLNSKYSDMWSDIEYDSINIKDLNGNVTTTNQVSKYFKKIRMTPYEWWKTYYDKWDNCKKPNVIRVSYDDMKDDFSGAMLELSEKLGSDRKEFQNITSKVGWYV